MLRWGWVIGIAALATGCTVFDRTSTPKAPERLSAGQGDIVIDVALTKAVPIGLGADLFGRTGQTGRILVYFIGARGSTARLQRQNATIVPDAAVPSNASVLAPTPDPAARPPGRAPSRSAAAPAKPRIPSGYTAAGAPVEIDVETGKSVTIEGRTLTVIDVSPSRLGYQLN